MYGKNLIAGALSAHGDRTLSATNPSTGETLAPPFHEATPEEIDRAARAAAAAFAQTRRRPSSVWAELLEAAADEIEALGGELVERVQAETGLPQGRVVGERGRTTGQLRLFAEMVREGSWVEARIDTADPDRTPAPKPDVRRMLIPIGPVAVFGASNFPLAFSVAGGDTASAFAAGCPVIVKAHPAHPGTSELVGVAIHRAVERVGLPAGTFSLLHGARPEVSIRLVEHPLIEAVGFTGSLTAGRALFDAAARRERPIPVYAEMGSVNPVFVLPSALERDSKGIREGLAGSVTLGAGQFCTNPGVVVGLAGKDLDRLAAGLGSALAEMPTFTLLHAGIRKGYERGVQALTQTSGVTVRTRGEDNESSGPATPAVGAVFQADAGTFLSKPRLREEVFGPSTLVVSAERRDQLLAVAEALEGSLTATIHGTDQDLDTYADLVDLLQRRVGRLIFNGFPTGVEVCPSMHHGGPYPATTDVRSTSVGTAAVGRFARPICYQDWPATALPPELRDGNPRRLLRMVDGAYTRDPI